MSYNYYLYIHKHETYKEIELNSEMLDKANDASSKPPQYRITGTDELFEFMWLKPFSTGLSVDIFVDDGGSYKRNGHVLLLFARNGYDKSVESFIPFSISNKPYVLDDDMEFNIPYDDIFLIMDFIQENEVLLKQLVEEEITHQEFVCRLHPVSQTPIE